MTLEIDLASVDHVLRTTRSVRRRIDFERAIERSTLEECIDVATQAPTGVNAESWRFLVLTEPDRKQALADLYRQALEGFASVRGVEVKPAQRALAERLHEMPALVVVCSEGSPMEALPMQVGFYGSILPAAWSLMLALRARGIGATWTTLHLVHHLEAAREFGIPADVTQTVLLPIGYTKNAVLRAAPRRPAAEVTFWNHWGKR
jgi:nitroreductase